MSEQNTQQPLDPSVSQRKQFEHKVTPHFFGHEHVPKEQFNQPSNKRKSTRYAWWSFLPIATILQFTKVVNIFYLCTAILQTIPSIQTNKPMATLIPLMFVISLGILKEAIAEIKRWQEDKEVNNTPVTRVTPAEPGSAAYTNAKDGEFVFEKTTLANIKVGDLLQISDREQVPADCIVLRTEHANSECFVKTAALDGERNLKPKLAVKAVSQQFYNFFKATSDKQIASVKVECIKAEKEMYTFDGKLIVQSADGESKSYPLDMNQFLHRGSFLENSGSVIALVIHTGVESKLIMNLGKYVFKRSRFERILNFVLVLNLLFAAVLAILGAFLNHWWYDNHFENHKYIFGEEEHNTSASFKSFFSFYLIVNSFVPLDLLVAIELSKLFYTLYMENDGAMMEPDFEIGDVKQMQAHTLTLHEELGLVEYIFCDKTGTLTQNELVFRGLCLNNGKQFSFANNSEVEAMKTKLMDADVDSSNETFNNFLRCIGLCHDCISVKNDKAPLGIAYNGPSVDEVCLLDMTRDSGLGYFTDRDSTHVRMMLDGKEEEFELLRTFKFTSDRKAMSVVIKDPVTGKVYAFVKGADSSIFPLCKRTELTTIKESKSDQEDLEAVENSVESMASKGLRTLLFAMKELTDWDPSQDPQDLLVEDIESNLTLLAATGVEDLLQDNVKECIQDFRRAGISVWMLTGDKGLTAKEIGVSCGLIPASHQPHQFNDHPTVIANNVSMAPGGDVSINPVILNSPGGSSVQKVESQTLEFAEDLTDPTAIYEVIKVNLAESKKSKMYQVLISGFVIQIILDNSFMHVEMAELLLKAESVIVSRSSPAQKAEVVLFMKKATGNRVTLAIGDGANDVNMIQQAHVGFGLMGKEGNQAASFADYAIPKFKDLRRMLFWHGRGYSVRMINFVYWCLFKSMLNATTKYVQQFQNGFSGHQPVDGLMLSLFNVTMTIWFLAFQSILDQDVSFRKYGGEGAEKNLPFNMSDLYSYSRHYCSKKKFLQCFLLFDLYSLFAGAVIFYIFYFGQGIANMDGDLFGLFSYGVFSTVAAVLIHHVQCGMYCRNWAWPLTAFFVFSITMLPVTIWLTQNKLNAELYKAIYPNVLSSPVILFMLFLAVAVVTLPLYAAKQIRQLILTPQFFMKD